MAYSTPRTWVAGEYPTAAQFNQNIRDNVAFLANPPACRVTNSATQSVNNNAEMTPLWDTEAFDTDNMHSTSVNTGRITFTTAGLYLVTWSLFYGADTDYTLVYSYLQKNGAGIHTLGSEVGTQADASTGPMTVGSTIDRFAVNDYVHLLTNQKNSNAGANSLQTQSTFSAVWLGV